MLDGPFVKATGFKLHHLDLLSDVLNAQRTGQPDRAPLDESLDVLPPNQRNVLAEAVSVGLDEAGAMLRFLLAHVVEDLRGVGIRFAQTISEIAVDATVLFFQKHSQSQNLSLGKLSEFLRHPFLFVQNEARRDSTSTIERPEFISATRSPGVHENPTDGCRARLSRHGQAWR